MEFSTTGRLERLTFRAASGRTLTYSVVFLEPALERELFGSERYRPLVRAGRLRFTGELEDVPVELAWQPSAGRGHYAMISPALCKQLALGVGSEVTLRFDLVDPERVAVPEDIARRVGRSARDAKRWAALTPGQQRALIAFAASARTDETRARRIADLFAPLARMPRAAKARARAR